MDDVAEALGQRSERRLSTLTAALGAGFRADAPGEVEGRPDADGPYDEGPVDTKEADDYAGDVRSGGAGEVADAGVEGDGVRDVLAARDIVDEGLASGASQRVHHPIDKGEQEEDPGLRNT